MTQSDERALAGLLLRLLLDDDCPDERVVDWNVLLPLARRNGTLLRVAARLTERSPAPPGPVVDAIATERRRVRDAFELVRNVSRVCTKHGIAFLGPEGFASLPH